MQTNQLNNRYQIQTSLTPRQWLSMVVLVLFVVAQFLTIVHAVEHPFHAADASCDSYIAAEKIKTSLADSCAQIVLHYFIESVSSQPDTGYFAAVSLSYWSRAPPLS